MTSLSPVRYQPAAALSFGERPAPRRQPSPSQTEGHTDEQRYERYRKSLQSSYMIPAVGYVALATFLDILGMNRQAQQVKQEAAELKQTLTHAKAWLNALAEESDKPADRATARFINELVSPAEYGDDYVKTVGRQLRNSHLKALPLRTLGHTFNGVLLGVMFFTTTKVFSQPQNPITQWFKELLPADHPANVWRLQPSVDPAMAPIQDDNPTIARSRHVADDVMPHRREPQRSMDSLSPFVEEQFEPLERG